MSQGVYITETEIVCFTEFFEPEIRCVIVHWLAIPLDEQAVVIYPLRSELFTLNVLLVLVLMKHIHYALRKFQRSLRFFCFSGVGIDAL